jgi:hypothetical protein
MVGSGRPLRATPAQTLALKDKAERALARLAHRVADSAISCQVEDRTMKAWGQYLDKSREKEELQVPGIYGTSSAVQLLVLTDELRKTHSAVIASAMGWLETEFEDTKSRSGKKRDGTVIFKCSAFVAAGAASRAGNHDTAQLAAILVSKRCAAAWGNTENDEFPSAMSTATALLALIKCLPDLDAHSDETILLREHIQQALDWLVGEVKRDAELFRTNKDGLSRDQLLVELAIALLALRRYNAFRKTSALQSHLHAEKDLIRLIESIVDRLRVEPNVTAVHFFVSEPDSRNRYVLSLVAPVVALSLLESGRLARNFTYITDVANAYIEQMTLTGFYKGSTTRREATGDQYWIGALLAALTRIDVNAQHLRRDRVMNWWVRRAHTKTFYAIMLGFFVLMGVVAGYFATDIKGHPLWTALFGGIGAGALFFASLSAGWLKDEITRG